MEFGLNDPLRK